MGIIGLPAGCENRLAGTDRGWRKPKSSDD